MKAMKATAPPNHHARGADLCLRNTNNQCQQTPGRYVVGRSATERYRAELGLIQIAVGENGARAPEKP